MNNTVITSISALVFLVIGLFIGKSNKQIEIQTVLKTNIVEKPITEYVDKYITNVVEKIINTKIPDEFIEAKLLQDNLNEPIFLGMGDLPKTIGEISVSINFVGENKSNIQTNSIKDEIELNLRKIGINVVDNSQRFLNLQIATVNGTKDNPIVVYVSRLSFLVPSYYIWDRDEIYKSYSTIWSHSQFGYTGQEVFSDKKIQETVNQSVNSFMNSYLKSVQKQNKK